MQNHKQIRIALFVTGIASKRLSKTIAMKYFIFLLAVAAIACQTAYAQDYSWKQASSGGYTYRYVTHDPMAARFYTLKNGLTVILSINKKEPRIQTLFGVRAGSNNDPEDHTGLAHYLEHLLFKGTWRYGSLDSAKEKPWLDQIEALYDLYNHTTDAANRKAIYHGIDSISGIAAKYAIANEYDKLMSGMGAQGTNAHTSVEETVYEEDIPSSAIDKYLAVQAERFRNPVFRLFHTELEAVYEEKNRGLDNDGRKVFETLLAALFPTHHYGTQTTIGTVEHLKNPSLKAIRNFYNTYYVPNNMAIVMAGDLDPDSVIRKIDAAFGYMQPKTVAGYKAPQETPVTSPIIKNVYGPDAEKVTIGFRMPGALHTREAVLLTALSQVLSNDKAGLIDLDLNQPQKVLGAGAGVNYWKDYSFFVLSGKAKEGQTLETVKDLLLKELGKLRQGDFDESLLRAIAANFKLDELQGLDKNGSRAQQLMDGFIKHRGENWDKDAAFVDDMSRVTKAELISFAKKYLNNNYVVVYKRKGEARDIEKVEKPPITPVPVNREAQSEFAKLVMAMPATPVAPQWLDYQQDIRRATLNGAQLLYVQNKDNAIFHLYYRFEMGTWNNRLLPLAAEYLDYLGTGKLSAAAIAKQFYNIACNISVNPGKEEMLLTLSGLEENFVKGITLMEDLIRHCKPDETALGQLKARITKARADSKLNKQAILRGLTQYAVYGEKNPFNYQLSPAELDKVTAAELVSLLHDLFSYEHTVIYYGPETLTGITAQIGQLHALPVAFKPIPPAVRFEKQDQSAPRVLFTDYDMVQAEVEWVRNGPKYDPAMITTVDLFNNYFGGGMGSVVFQTIRESKALAYSTYAFYSSPNKKDDRYTTVAYVGSQADKMKEAISGMDELLNTMPESEQAFETARQSMKQDIETERVTGDGIIFSYLAAKRLGFDNDYRKAVYNDIDRIAFNDILKLHDQELKTKPYTLCVLASAKKISQDDLKPYGEVKTLTLEEIFGY